MLLLLTGNQYDYCSRKQHSLASITLRGSLVDDDKFEVANVKSQLALDGATKHLFQGFPLLKYTAIPRIYSVKSVVIRHEENFEKLIILCSCPLN